MTQYDSTKEQVSGWALGGVMFAATLMIMVGFFQAFAGLTAIVGDDFYVVTANYVFDFDLTTWGWIHLTIGTLVGLAGFALLGGREWAGVVTLVLAVLSAVSNFLFIPYYPFWSLLTIALACWVIWALTRPGVLRA